MRFACIRHRIGAILASLVMVSALMLPMAQASASSVTTSTVPLLVWTAASYPPNGTAGASVQVEIQPVSGYTGGTVSGKSVAWLGIPDYLMATMETQAGVSNTPLGWYVSTLGSDQYAEVVGVKYAGSTYTLPGITGDTSWVKAMAWAGGDAAISITYPSSSSGTVAGPYTPATDVIDIQAGTGTTQQTIDTPLGPLLLTIAGSTITHQSCVGSHVSITTGCPSVTIQYEGNGQVKTQAKFWTGTANTQCVGQATACNAMPKGTTVNTYQIYSDEGNGLTPVTGKCGATGQPGMSDPCDWANSTLTTGAYPFPVLGGNGQTVTASQCLSPNLIVNGMCVLASSLPSGETVTQAVYGLLQHYYESSVNCVTLGQCPWFSFLPGDPTP